MSQSEPILPAPTPSNSPRPSTECYPPRPRGTGCCRAGQRSTQRRTRMDVGRCTLRLTSKPATHPAARFSRCTCLTYRLAMTTQWGPFHAAVPGYVEAGARSTHKPPQADSASLRGLGQESYMPAPRPLPAQLRLIRCCFVFHDDVDDHVDEHLHAPFFLSFHLSLCRLHAYTKKNIPKHINVCMYAYRQTFVHAYIHVNTQLYANPGTKLSPIHIRQPFPSQPPSPSPQTHDTAQGIACSSFLRPVLISKPRQTLGNVHFTSRSAIRLSPYLPILHFLVYPRNLAAPCCANKVLLGDFCSGTVQKRKSKRDSV